MKNKMKPRISLLKFIVCSFVCVLLIVTPITTVHALPSDYANAIQRLLDDAVRISGTPGISVAIISGGQTHFINAGHTGVRNRSNATLVNEHTLYEIGSLSKAFTAFGILLLEEKGLLSTADRIEEHLPWFYLTYQNEVVAVTIQQLLNHTSGLGRPHSDAPRGEGADMLRRTVEPLVGARLRFAPGTDYEYGNANFNILGLIIEAVSGQSYEDFMIEHVFEPLGLYETFLFHSEAKATGRMAQGHRHAFFMTFPFDAPIYGGMKPTGFIISSAYDMARWMGIHLGLVHDIPEIFLRVIERTHIVDIREPQMRADTFYVNGWINNTNTGILGHAGQTPNFLSNFIMFPEDGQGVIFLSNGTSVDFDLVWGIGNILDGDLEQAYSRSDAQRRNIMLSIIIIAAALYTLYKLITGIRSRIKEKPIMTKSKIIGLSIEGLMLILSVVFLLFFPTISGSGWHYILDWSPLTLTILLFSIPFELAVSTWVTYVANPKPKNDLETEPPPPMK